MHEKRGTSCRYMCTILYAKNNCVALLPRKKIDGITENNACHMSERARQGHEESTKGDIRSPTKRSGIMAAMKLRPTAYTISPDPPSNL